MKTDTPRIYLARLMHETNGFSPAGTRIEDFRRVIGKDVARSARPASMVRAILRRGSESGCELVPGFDFGAPPGGMVPDEVVERALSALEDTLKDALKDGLSGVFLILHGAMMSRSCDDVEGLVLERTRGILAGRDIPVGAVLDLHANVSLAMARHADILLAYRCNPHTDAVEAGLRAFDLLVEAARGRQHFATRLVQSPVLLAPDQTASDAKPMAGLLALARELEVPPIRAVSVCPGFAHADTPHTGLSFQIVHDRDDARAADRSARALEDHVRELFWETPDTGVPVSMAIADGLAAGNFPALLVNPSDNIGGGAPGNSTWVLEALLDSDAEGSGVILALPNAVETCRSTPGGGTINLQLGGEFPELTGPAVEVRAEVVRRSNGRFEVEDLRSHFVSSRGSTIEMGPSVLLRAAGIWILLTSRPTPPMDLGQWRSMGVNPEGLRFIEIKAAVAHRQAYDPIAKAHYLVATPGPATSNLCSLSFRNLRRPIFPLDDNMPPSAVRSGESASRKISGTEDAH